MGRKQVFELVALAVASVVLFTMTGRVDWVPYTVAAWCATFAVVGVVTVVAVNGSGNALGGRHGVGAVTVRCEE